MHSPWDLWDPLIPGLPLMGNCPAATRTLAVHMGAWPRALRSEGLLLPPQPANLVPARTGPNPQSQAADRRPTTRVSILPSLWKPATRRTVVLPCPPLLLQAGLPGRLSQTCLPLPCPLACPPGADPTRTDPTVVVVGTMFPEDLDLDHGVTVSGVDMGQGQGQGQVQRTMRGTWAANGGRGVAVEGRGPDLGLVLAPDPDLVVLPTEAGAGPVEVQVEVHRMQVRALGHLRPCPPRQLLVAHCHPSIETLTPVSVPRSNQGPQPLAGAGLGPSLGVGAGHPLQGGLRPGVEWDEVAGIASTVGWVHCMQVPGQGCMLMVARGSRILPMACTTAETRHRPPQHTTGDRVLEMILAREYSVSKLIAIEVIRDHRESLQLPVVAEAAAEMGGGKLLP